MKKYNPTLNNITALLQDQLPHSGQSLATALGISRTTIRKNIKILQQYGIAIETHKSQGYRLMQPFSLLESEYLTSGIKALIPNAQLHLFESLDSTITQLKKILAQRPTNDERAYICLAEHMSQGVGRFRRKWDAPFGDNLYFSMAYTFPYDTSQLAGLSLVIALTIIKTLESYNLQQLQVKWPNDVYQAKRKISGNLLEIIAEAHSKTCVIISIGINVNQPHLQPSDEALSWRCMQAASGQYIDRNQLCIRLVQQLLLNLQQFQRHGLQHFIPQWQPYDMLSGQEIVVHQQERMIHGDYLGLSPQGHIKLKNAAGQVLQFAAGDVSLRAHTPYQAKLQAQCMDS